VENPQTRFAPEQVAELLDMYTAGTPVGWRSARPAARRRVGWGDGTDRECSVGRRRTWEVFPRSVRDHHYAWGSAARHRCWPREGASEWHRGGAAVRGVAMRPQGLDESDRSEI